MRVQLLLYSLAAPLLVGCAHQLDFKVVDASSDAPLQGAEVKVSHVGPFAYFYRKAHERSFGSTGADDVIRVNKVGQRDVIYFSATGYRAAAAGFEGRGKLVINSIPGK